VTSGRMPIMAESPPHWMLISVLFSSLPLSDSLAMSLYQVARELHRGDLPAGEVMEEMAQGRVRNLRKVFAIGSITGPGFEADLETERGKGLVRFLITREGLARTRGERRPKPKAALLN
jgi:hypothetical protein